jgi:hypothetical protein
VNIPDFLTRYYQKGEYPFMSLNDLPLEEANRVKTEYCTRNGIGKFYAQDDYLIHRKEIENWICRELIRLGGNPVDKVPVYMVLGESPEGEFDIRAEIQQNAEEIKIPVSDIDLSSISFTYPDSMYEHIVDDDGNLVSASRTNTPTVYTYEDLPSVVEKYRIYENYRFNIEAQVWDREMLHRFWLETKGEIKN